MLEVKEEFDPTNLINKPWQNFLNKFKEIDTLPILKWKEVHILAYICKRYEVTFNKKFAISYKGAPSKSTEIYFIKKIMAMLSTMNMSIIKNYVDWMFDIKIIPKKVKIKSLGYFITPGFGNEFNFYREEKTKVCKTTELPTEYKTIASTLNLSIITYGDLAFIKMALDQNPNEESRKPYHILFDSLKEVGFEPSILNELV